MPARAILFDFNGVIVDDEAQHCESLIATLGSMGVSLDRETYYRDYLGFDDRECFRHSLAAAGRSTDPRIVDDAIEQKAVRYEAAVRDSLALVPGASAFIAEAAAQGIVLAVASGALRREIELVLRTAGLRSCFGAIVSAEDVERCKPDPAGFLLAAARIGVPAEDCVVIEDSLPGLAAARAGGFACAMLTTSHPAELLDDADLVWDDFRDHHPDDLPWP